MNEYEIKSSDIETDSAADINEHTVQKPAEDAAAPHVPDRNHQRSFMQRNKYRIRQICGIVVLAGIITASALVLTKCGSNIDEASSAVDANVPFTDDSSSESDSQSETATSSQTTTTSSTTTTTQTTTETTTESATETTAQETTTTAMPTTTTSKLTTHNPKPTTTSKQTVKPAPRPTGDAKIEVKNGITYVNGILIANKTYPVPSTYNPGLDPQAQAAFNKMQQAAAAQGIYLWICSGFRSYSYQSQLYNNYVAVDGKAAADRYSARPGYSEHQTGLAMDINYASSYFDNTPEAKWLAAHCSDYGFIIRYKAGKESSTGYMAESWHIRYLGDVSLCKSIEASGLSLEEYLGITSVYANP